MDDACRGCVIYNESNKNKGNNGACPIGIIPVISKSEECPCRKCLVKMMCTGVCDEFKVYVNKSRRITEMRNKNGE